MIAIIATPVADSIWQQAVAKLSPRGRNKRFARTSKFSNCLATRGCSVVDERVFDKCSGAGKSVVTLANRADLYLVL